MTFNPVADVPSVTATAAPVNEDHSSALSITINNLAAALENPDDSASVKITGVPAGATLSAGTLNLDGSWTLTPAQLAGLSLTPVADFEGTLHLTVTTTFNDGSASNFTTTPLDVTFNPVADVPVLSAPNTSGAEGSPIALTIAVTNLLAIQEDPTDIVTVHISGLTAGAILSDAGGTLTPTAGVYTLSLADLASLKVLAPEFSDISTITMTVQAFNNDSGNIAASAALPLTVTLSDPGPSIGPIQNSIMPNIVNTDAHGTWQPFFGADGLNATAAIGIAMGGAPAGEVYTTAPDGNNLAGQAITEVTVTPTTGTAYTFFEYTVYNAATQTDAMFAFKSLGGAQAGTTSDEFFTLSMAAAGTYDFHLVSNDLQSTQVFDLTQFKSGTGAYFEIVGTSGAFHSGAIPASGGDLVISAVGGTLHANAQGFGVNTGNFETGQTLDFKFENQLQNGISFGIGKGGNAVTEHFVISIYNGTTLVGTENVTQLDGTAVIVDAAHWGLTGTTTGVFGAFNEVTVLNDAGTVGTGGSAGDDTKVNLTGVSFNEHALVSDTTLTFAPTITNGDGDIATSASNLTVALVGTHNAAGGYSLSGTNDVFVASAGGHDVFIASGLNNTIDLSNVTTAVTADLHTATQTYNWGATGDTSTGIENLIGSAHGGDIITGDLNNNILDFGFNALASTATGGAGSDTFKLENLNVTEVITDFNVGGTADTVDLSALLHNVDTTKPLSNYVTYNAATGALSVDTAGDGVAANFKVVATLDTAAAHPGAGTVNILYEDTALVHHTTTI